MDALSFLTTMIPSYFTIGPLAIILLVLVVLIGKKDKGTISIANETIATPVPTPLAATPPLPEVSAPVPAPTSSPVAEATAPAAPLAPAYVEPVVSHLGAITPSPSVTPPPVQASATPVASVPPVSSWKPATPAPSAVGESLGESEAQMQAKASASEGSSHEVVPASVTAEVSEPAKEIPVSSEVAAQTTTTPEAPTTEVAKA